MDNIIALNIIFENGDEMLINKKELKDFCICNIDEKGNEIPYESTIIKNKLYANFLLLNLNSDVLSPDKKHRLKAKNDITELMVIFRNNKFVKFVVASNANPFAAYYHNDYEYVYDKDNSLGLLLSQYNIKYKENLFV